MARIPLLDETDVPEEYRDLMVALSPKEGLPEEYHHLIEDPTRNIYRVLGHVPPILKAFRGLARVTWQECGLDSRERELVILTAARELESAYEWHQHVRIALREGLSVEEIRAIAENNEDPFTSRERALRAYVTAFVDGAVDADAHDSVRAHYDEAAVVGIGILVGIYLTIARLTDALDVEVEEKFVGWDLAGL